MTFPKPITALHAIEVTSRCNLACAYCPHPSLIRPGENPARQPVDMAGHTFKRALDWVEHFRRLGTQSSLDLSGIGEPTLHPGLRDMILEVRRRFGRGFGLSFPTNGLRMTEELAAFLAEQDVEVWVSLHVLDKGMAANEVLRRHGVRGSTSADGAVNANDWAGQVAVPWKKDYSFPCPWLNNGQAFVYADGRIGRCCLDARGVGALGHVNDEVGSLSTSPYELCRGCYQTISDGTWDQRAGAPR